ncbi:MAG: hypothetical protein ABSG65_19375 [Bryobacteraceae bacterium]|jgi:hypothetical protein
MNFTRATFAGIAIVLAGNVAAAYAADSACTPPTQITGSPEETAWRIFVAATCPTGNPHKYPFVTWETWIEQHQQYPTSSTAKQSVSGAMTIERRFHRSPLGEIRKNPAALALPQGANTGCGPGGGDPSVTLCEEVRLNPGKGGTSEYVTKPAAGQTLEFRTQQAKFAASSPSSKPAIDFPTASVEIKADWIQLPTAACAQTIKQNKIWIEYIGTQCYALAGMHLISKLTPNWIWATFEAQNLPTNPQRCVVLGCNDPFGSDPAKTPPNQPSATTKITEVLKGLMVSAKLNTVWQNYRMDGVQTDFVDSSGNPILLGNSIIEGENANVPLNSSSCITCHHASSISAAGSESFGLGLLAKAPIGNPTSLPPGVFSRDFLWSLSLACPNSVFQGCASAPPEKRH